MSVCLAAQERYRNGAFAEQFVTPAECLTIIRKSELHSMAQWATLIYFYVAQGAIVRGEVKVGQVQGRWQASPFGFRNVVHLLCCGFADCGYLWSNWRHWKLCPCTGFGCWCLKGGLFRRSFVKLLSLICTDIIQATDKGCAAQLQTSGKGARGLVVYACARTAIKLRDWYERPRKGRNWGRCKDRQQGC